jgi:hypothetical protein
MDTCACVLLLLLACLCLFLARRPRLYGLRQPALPSLQSLIDAAPAGHTLVLTQDYLIHRTLTISKELSLQGNHHKIELHPDAGTVAVLRIGTVTPASLCALSCADWGAAWIRGTSLANVTVENLVVKGNYDSAEASRDYQLRDSYCSCDRGVKGSNLGALEATVLCGSYKDKEADTSMDALEIFQVQQDGACAGSCCPLSGALCAEPPSSPCADIKASGIVVLNASNVNLVNVTATCCRSAGISAFFGCRELKLSRCTMHSNRFDGFGPDCLVSATLDQCVFKSPSERNAAISISAGAGAAPGPLWYGRITISNCAIGPEWPIGVYANSPNAYDIRDLGLNLAALAVKVEEGLVIAEARGSVQLSPCAHVEYPASMQKTAYTGGCTIGPKTAITAE